MPARPLRQRAGGFTLIEILIVILIGSLLVTLGLSGFSSVTKRNLRESAGHLSGAIRYLFDRASTTGKIHRLVLDLGNGKYWAEVSDDHFYVPHEAETEQQLREREAKEADQDEEERQRKEERDRLWDRSTSFSSSSSSSSSSSDSDAFGSSSPFGLASSYDPSKLEAGNFQPKRARFAAFKELALKPVDLKKAKFKSVYTPRVTDPITTGRAYIYFFPLGQTEPAIITLTDPREESAYSLVVHPITGRVRIYSEEVEPPAAGTQVDDEGATVVK